MSLIDQAFDLACAARLNAHAPYSNFLVGAAVKAIGSDRLIGGCNVENASYGATICAERNAICSLTAQQGKSKIDFLVLVTDTDPVAMPCAMCRQVLAEFSTPETEIHVGNLKGIQKVVTFAALLPYPFTENDL